MKKRRGVFIGVDTGLLHLANCAGKACRRNFIQIQIRPRPAFKFRLMQKNLGGIAQIPNIDEVYQTLMDCVAVYGK